MCSSDGEVWWVWGRFIIHHTVYSPCLSSTSSPLSLNLSTSPTSTSTTLQVCVCVLLWKVLLGYRRRESADINTGEAPCWVWRYKTVAQCALQLWHRFPVWLLKAAAGRLMTHPKHTHTQSHRNSQHKRGTWTGRMHGGGSTCGTHIQHECVLLPLCVA